MTREQPQLRRHAGQPFTIGPPSVPGRTLDKSNETGDELGLGQCVQLLGRADLFHPPVSHDGDAVANGERVFLVMGDENGRDAFVLQNGAHFVAHLAAQSRVQVAERLVQQQRRRSRRQRPCQREALLLPAGQFMRITMRVIANPTSSRTSWTRRRAALPGFNPNADVARRRKWGNNA